jgi:tRNA-specific 2-thiouridylase
MKKTVVVGLSGGVDSSLSALLLKERGYHVIGLFMKNWEEADGPCTAVQDFDDVVRVSQALDIPYYSVNFVEEYRQNVFAEFLRDFQAGLTPNPDILCNREIKFKAFLDKALQLGADYIATGHYARLDSEGRLLKGLDPDKDQSYFLHAVKQEAFQKVLFPVGDLLKKEVRQLAKKYNLATHAKKDSTGICFIGKRDFKTFMSQYVAICPGPFETLDGTVVGQHDGSAFYTIGQRKGLGLGGEGDAWYVIGKDGKRNAVIVERGASHPALFSTFLYAKDFTWVSQAPSSYPFCCSAKIRYRQQDTPCTLFEDGRVEFAAAQRAVTPGQSIVFYQGDLCLGGALIRPLSKPTSRACASACARPFSEK